MSPTICHRLLFAALNPDIADALGADDSLVLVTADEAEAIAHQLSLDPGVIASDAIALAASIREGGR